MTVLQQWHCFWKKKGVFCCFVDCWKYRTKFGYFILICFLNKDILFLLNSYFCSSQYFLLYFVNLQKALYFFYFILMSFIIKAINKYSCEFWYMKKNIYLFVCFCNRWVLLLFFLFLCSSFLERIVFILSCVRWVENNLLVVK